MTNLDSILKSRDLTLLTKVHIVKAMVFPVATYGSESWTIKMADRRRFDAFWIVVLEETLENKPICFEGNQPWVLTGRTDPETEAPILWPFHETRILPEKDLDVRKVWRQEEKRTTEDKMVGQCHRSYQHEVDLTPGGSGRQKGLVCSGLWGHEESNTT